LNPTLKSSQNLPQDYHLESRGEPRNVYCWAEKEKDAPNKQAGPPIPVAFIKGSRKRYRDPGTAGESKETSFRRPLKGNNKHFCMTTHLLTSRTANKTSFVAKFQEDLLATPIRMEGAPILHARPEAVKKELGYNVMTSINAQMNLLRPGTVGEFTNGKGKELSFTAAAAPACPPIQLTCPHLTRYRSPFPAAALKIRRIAWTGMP